jgi:hypothetical protein
LPETTPLLYIFIIYICLFSYFELQETTSRIPMLHLHLLQGR